MISAGGALKSSKVKMQKGRLSFFRVARVHGFDDAGDEDADGFGAGVHVVEGADAEDAGGVEVAAEFVEPGGR